MLSLRPPLAYVVTGFCAAFCLPVTAQVPGPNVNMVSGTQWPGGDPFLQRQNEPSISISTRNPLHLLGGANDYRSVDLPSAVESGTADPDSAATADAWLGVFKSRDGGLTWFSTLLPGYPQDTSPAGMASPIKGFAAAADPTVRFGTNGMAYYSGIAFDRSKTGRSILFVARFIDDNNNENTNADTLRYLSTLAVDNGNAGQFLDKPSLAVDLPRSGGATCSFPPSKPFAAGNVYLSYTNFTGNSNANPHTKLMFARSTDCGATWSTQSVNEADVVYQGSAIAIDPSSGAIYLAFRRFALNNQTDAILISKSTDQGKTFSTPVQIVPSFFPYNPDTTGAQFRTSSVPAIAVDNTGRVYVAWSSRLSPAPSATADARIVVATSRDGVNWTQPAVVDPIVGGTSNGRGHQMMPALSFSGGMLALLYYTQQDDQTIRIFGFSNGLYPELAPRLAPDLASGNLLFTDAITDASPYPNDALVRRHTFDVRMGQASPADAPSFSFAKVSQYPFGIRNQQGIDCTAVGASTVPNSPCAIEQLQYNTPNLPMFQNGTVPFMGDYIDIAGLNFVQNTAGGPWSFNANAIPAPVFHTTWTDNRNVRKPANGDWTQYTPVTLPGPSVLDPTQQRPACVPANTGSRNQDIYTSRVTQGLYVGSLGNNKPLDPVIQRAFTVFVQNATDQTRSFHMSISTPAGVTASFAQFGPALAAVDVTIARRSSIARTVFATGAPATARIVVNVTENAEVPPVVSLGLQAAVILNPDDSAATLVDPGTVPNFNVGTDEFYTPDIGSPDIGSPDIGSYSVTNPDIGSPDIGSPDIGSPDIGSPDIGSPDIGSPDIGSNNVSNPDIGSPDIGSPDIGSPDIGSADVATGSLQDATWNVTNQGNTSASYGARFAGTPPRGLKFQVVVRRVYSTPAAVGCTLAQQTHNVVVANITGSAAQIFTSLADLGNTNLNSSDLKNITFALDPGQSARITLRAVGAAGSGITKAQVDSFLSTGVTAAVVPQAVNTIDAQQGVTLPPIFEAGTTALTILTKALPTASLNTFYSFTLAAKGGTAPLTWHYYGTLPNGINFDQTTGTFSGTPTQTGSSFGGYVIVTDSSTPQQAVLGIFSPSIVVVNFLSYVTPPGNVIAGQPFAPAIQLRVADATNLPLPGVLLTLGIQNNPTGGTLSGTITQMSNALGIATFPDLTIDRGGVGYTLTNSPSFKVEGFAPGVPMGTPRDHHSSTLLPPALCVPLADCVLLAGGTTMSGGALQTTEVQQLQSNGGTLVISAALMTAARYSHTATALPSNSKVLVTGGVGSGGTPQVSAELYTPPPPALWFASGAPGGILNPRAYHTATLLQNGTVLIAGGMTFGGLPTAAAVIYDPVTDGYTPTAGLMANPRENHTATLLAGGQVLITGGDNGLGHPYSSAELYDPTTGVFTLLLSTMSSVRTSHTATLLQNGKVLVAGGTDLLGNPVGQADLFDPGTNSFTATGVLLAARSFHTATLLNSGQVLLAGGLTAAGYTASTELYDPVGGLFHPGPSMLAARDLHTATLISGGRIFISGGRNGVTTLNSTELFYPIP